MEQPKKGGKTSKGVKGKGKETKKGDDSQLTVFGAGFRKIDQEPLFCERLVLLTDVIYGKEVPEEFRGMQFVYKVCSWDSEEMTFKLKYQNRMIKFDGVEWEFQDGSRADLNDVKFPTVKAGDKLDQKA